VQDETSSTLICLCVPCDGSRYFMVVHAHEHLGQAIAYSRSVDVVPPWDS
jgi:hypothetical protein